MPEEVSLIIIHQFFLSISASASAPAPLHPISEQRPKKQTTTHETSSKPPKSPNPALLTKTSTPPFLLTTSNSPTSFANFWRMGVGEEISSSRVVAPRVWRWDRRDMGAREVAIMSILGERERASIVHSIRRDGWWVISGHG